MHSDSTPRVQRPPIDTHELAWAAGFFDGEGWVGFHRWSPKNQRSPQTVIGLSLGQVHPEVLARFQKAVRGLGSINGPYIHKSMGSNNKPRWQYRVSGFERVQAIVAMLWPWLSSVKREQARDAIITARAEIRPIGRPNNTFCIRGHDQGVYRHVAPNGRVVCRECQRMISLAAMYRRKGNPEEAQKVLDGTHVLRKDWRRKDRLTT